MTFYSKAMMVLVVLGMMHAAAHGANILFQEDFEDGSYTDSLNRWNASTSWSASVKNGGVPSSGKYLYTNDKLNYGLYFSSKVGFDYVGKQMEYSADMQAGSAGFPDQRYAHLYVAKNVGVTKSSFIYLRIYGSNHGGSPSGATPRPNEVWAALLYEDGAGELQWESLSGLSVANGNAWNNGKIVIRPDRRVEFHVNGSLFYTSANQVTDDFDGTAPIMVGGRKSNYDNMLVEDFGTGAAAVPGPLAIFGGLGLMLGMTRRLGR